MRRKWIGWFAVLAAAALLIPLSPWFGAPKQQPGKIQAPVKATAASREHTIKMKTINRDMEATALMCTRECSRNLHKMMMSRSIGDPGPVNMADMMKKHKQMVYLVWIHNGKTMTHGKKPQDANKMLQTHLAAAKASLRQGRDYTSTSLKLHGHRYAIVAVPDHRRRGDGIIGVILQDVITEVERHQKRNLRIVPYPAEGHYKIESVIPNTTTDMTVEQGEDNGNASHYHINEVVVKFSHPPTRHDLDRMKTDIGAISVKKLAHTFIFRSKLMDAESMMDYFKRTWQPEYVEPHYLYMTNDIAPIIPNDALYSEYQWNLPSIETEKGWTLSKGSERVLVAILDTGVQADHPDLQGKTVDGINLVSEDDPPEDDVGHGTHVAGIIAANVNNGEGVAGLSWYNKLMPVKVLDASGAGSTYTVAQGIIWATDNGAKVINMSLGNYAEAEFLHDAVKYAYDHDVVLVAASGNDNTDRPGYPAAYPEVFGVASTDADGSRSSFSNFGDYIDVAAPGASIASTYPGSQYAALSGTSMASPHVAALAGLIRSINPDLTNVEVMDIMRKSATDLGDKGKDNYFGYGQIDIVQALEMANQSKLSLQQFEQQVEQRLAKIKSKYESHLTAAKK
ncbi:S8 family peptidase [Paenibacillus sepulcri]|uniref:S8 family peptidase n=1 Tax=Paenibacillus sepulcri TaxID=359917 RepID=A0ABS7C114_9BACL|nr:S8 family peptidase [Paenibacillus sepulcri]